MKKKMSFSTLIVVSVVITLLTSLQIAASSPSVQSNPHPTIEIRPLQDSVTVTPQPFAHTSEDYVQVQDAIASVLSNYPTASLTDIKIDGQWAYGIVKLADTNEFFALAHLLPNGVWQVALPDNGTIYTQWLDTLPENLIPLTEKRNDISRIRIIFLGF
ncbi:MAG: hypothetical protein M5U34_42350 [Chloroflexi bacterium]|nr:hypothetical protein [Chloroflexota bacterium]